MSDRPPRGVQAAVTRELTRRIQSRSVCHMGCGAALEVRTTPWKPAARQRSTTRRAGAAVESLLAQASHDLAAVQAQEDHDDAPTDPLPEETPCR
ncbi:hypothetical protein [Streptomyces sp. NPDC102476]|uniref:hypothetical protein n=1 Tax=Streptomyces sp. NPDC102476 TaxID=3366181 RepID=UPI00382F44EC